MPIDTTQNFTVQIKTPVSTARIKKMSICWSGRIANSGVAAYIATNFDLCSCDCGHATNVQTAKTTNPNIIMIGYHDASFEPTYAPDFTTLSTNHEDYFVHDTVAATPDHRIIPDSASDIRLMNIGSGWSNYLAALCLTDCTGSNSAYDGMFIDDATCCGGGYWTTYTNALGTVVAKTSFEDAVYANWNPWQQTHVANIKTHLGTKWMMPNISDVYNTYFDYTPILNTTKAIWVEGFPHASWHSSSTNALSAADTVGTINLLYNRASLGDIITTGPGLSDGSNTTAARQWMVYSYAVLAFCAVDLTKTYFSFMFYGQSDGNLNKGYWAEWDDLSLMTPPYSTGGAATIGTPVAAYHVVTGSVYAREFANYYVLANLANLGTSTTFTFNGTSYTLPGKQAFFIHK